LGDQLKWPVYGELALKQPPAAGIDNLNNGIGALIIPQGTWMADVNLALFRLR
jgi:hypothetical protein